MPPGRRRGRGEGSIYQRPSDKLWVGSLNLGHVGGVRKRKVVYGKTRAEVHEKLDKARAEWNRTGVVTNARLTVADWLGIWLERLEADQAVAPLTLANYQQKMGKVADLLGRRRFDDLTAEHIREVYRALGKKHARTYVEQTHNILKLAMKAARFDGATGRDVMEQVKTPKVGAEPVSVKPLLPIEFLMICPVIGGTRLESRWLLQNTLGLRQAEVLGLGWEDVDLDTGTVTIRRALQRQHGKHGCKTPCERTPGRCPQRVAGGLTFVKPKSKASGEPLPLPPILWESMRTRYAVWLGEEHPPLTRYGSLAPHSLVWGHARTGLPLDNTRDLKDWYAILDAAGVERKGTHSGRHGLATLLAQGGESVKMAQRLLRHANVATTLDLYTHVINTDERRAINDAEQAWRSGGEG